MSIGEALPLIIGAGIGVGIPMVGVMMEARKSKIIEKKIENISSEQFSVTPQMNESLKRFAVQNTFELRSMLPHELIPLLSCCASALVVYENHIERILEGYSLYQGLISHQPVPYPSFFNSQKIDPATGLAKILPAKVKKYASLKAKLDARATNVDNTFENDLLADGSVLCIIPVKYRISIILNMMCEYLSDGEVESWEGCIKAYKDNEHRLRQREDLQSLFNTLERIER